MSQIQKCSSVGGLGTSSSSRCWLHGIPLGSSSQHKVDRRKRRRSTTVDRSVSVGSSIDIKAPLKDAETSKEKFNWHKRWWPVQFTYNLDTDRPNRIQLLGEFFAVWKSKNGEWVAMKDMCPHRLAPLSEGTPPDPMPLLRCCVGRVEDDGTLMCSYHGWRFNDCGKCVKIPQADDERSHETACNNPRSAAQTYPCKDHGSLLWIWPTVSTVSELNEAASTPLDLSDRHADYVEGLVQKGIKLGFVRRLPYDYEFLMENFLDPAHIPFTHHGVIPTSTRSQGKPLPMKWLPPSRSNSSIAVQYFENPSVPSRLELFGRCLIVYQFPESNSQEERTSLLLLMTPVEDGTSIVLLFDVPGGPLTGKEKLKGRDVVARMFPFVDHAFRNTVLDGDPVFLHRQDSHVRENGGREWTPQMYFTPASADSMVMHFRKWLSAEGGGGPFGATRLEKRGVVSRRELLDRYYSHTLQCKECQRALGFFEQLAEGFKAIRFLSLAVGAWLATKALLHGALTKWQGAVAVTAFALAWFFERFVRETVIPQFYFVDYVHAEKN